MELSGLAVIDLIRKTAFHLEAIQTMDLQNNETLLDFYTRKILERREQLIKVSTHLVADAYFLKKNFVNDLTNSSK